MSDGITDSMRHPTMPRIVRVVSLEKLQAVESQLDALREAAKAVLEAWGRFEGDECSYCTHPNCRSSECWTEKHRRAALAKLREACR